MNNNEMNIKHIPQEKFKFAQLGEKLSDKKLETKPIGYLKDAWLRFKKNKSSVVAAWIIILLVLFAIVGPLMSGYDSTYREKYMASRLPKSEWFSWAGWNGCSNTDVSEIDYWYYYAMGVETGHSPIHKVRGDYYFDVKMGTKVVTKHAYKISLDSYTLDGVRTMMLTAAEYADLQAYQDEHNVQIIYPALPAAGNSADATLDQYNANFWYARYEEGSLKGLPVGINLATGEVDWQPLYIEHTGADNYTSKMRIEENGEMLYDYAIHNQTGYAVRVSYYDYYQYVYGKEPCFLFGTNQYGADICVRLASGAKFSFLLAIAVSALNLIIGSVYGAIEGYYGGATDMVMERISDVLANTPFIVVATLFQLYLAKKVGPAVSLLFAFVLTGWIGIAARVRMQFYRFKNQEYVLAARTLGASDGRLMFKHIFPNSLGTIITGTILIIPGVIFQETQLAYLNIVNLESSGITSVGTLLSNGNGQLQSYPHILFFPALFISLLMISFNLFGNGLRDAFNPSLRGSED